MISVESFLHQLSPASLGELHAQVGKLPFRVRAVVDGIATGGEPIGKQLTIVSRRHSYYFAAERTGGLLPDKQRYILI